MKTLYCMKKIKKSLCFFIFLACFGAHVLLYANAYKDTARFYTSLVENSNPNLAMLTLFFQSMPKGGDLHHHYSGTLYAETFLDWVEQKGWWIDSVSYKILESPQTDGSSQALTVSQLKANETAYRTLLTLWSDKDFSNHFHLQSPPDQNFFGTFSYFGPASEQYRAQGLRLIKQRALQENVCYIETMLSSTGVQAEDFFSEQQILDWNQQLRQTTSQSQVHTILEEIRTILVADSNYQYQLNHYVEDLERDQATQEIDQQDFLMRYQTYAVRTMEPVQVFTDLLANFLVAQRSSLLVGVSIVGPENNETSLNDYTLHMHMFNHLVSLYPNVHRALHAGELALGMVPPQHLSFHITQALDIAQAQRIGHGIDLPYEEDSVNLLDRLKKSAVIEVNLTSNEFILDVKNNDHPYLIYSAYGVPLVIATDDSGVFRNNLTQQYVLLASRYKPSYKTIKGYVYNSLKYSFLDSENQSKLTQLLDQKFAAFESEMSQFSQKLSLTEKA